MSETTMSEPSWTDAAFWSSRKSFLLRGLLAAVIAAVVMQYLNSRFIFCYDIQSTYRSLPWSAYLVDRQDTNVARGSIMAFRAERMIAPFRDGMLVAKKVVGIPGDFVVVKPEHVQINNEIVKLNTRRVLGEERGTPVYLSLRNEVVPQDSYFALGTHERSYDSRFWGYLRKDQIVGRVIPLW